MQQISFNQIVDSFDLKQKLGIKNTCLVAMCSGFQLSYKMSEMTNFRYGVVALCWRLNVTFQAWMICLRNIAATRA